jgi:SAM-dependent methyltransferase
MADFINDRLKSIPGVHTALKSIMNSFAGRKTTQGMESVPLSHISSEAAAPPSVARTETLPAFDIAHRSEEMTPTIIQEQSLNSLPYPPLEMRELVGPTQLAAFDNPNGSLVYEHLTPESYDKVFDFGCGCGRVARQLILQRPSPSLYVGVDLHAGMIRWCQRNLQPAAPNFSFLHHDVFNARFNPGAGKQLTAPFAVPDSHFTLVNALSVFTHVTEEQAIHYLRECARILTSDGILHASWFFFDKRDYPMMREENNSLYVSYVDPSAAVIFDRNWVVTTARGLGFRICGVVAPQIKGHQWLMMMTRKQNVVEAEFPPDLAPRGWARPPLGSNNPDLIGLDPD